MLISPLTAEDWVCWRGPNGNGIVDAADWSPDALKDIKILWTVELGMGYSSVSIQGTRIYSMGNLRNVDYVYCLDVNTGKKIWDYSYNCNPGSYPGPKTTPILDGNNLYTLSRKGDLFCFNAQTGKIIWQRQLMKELGVKRPGYDIAATPHIEGDMLLLNVNEYGAALNKKDGSTIWTSPSAKCGYAVPVVYTMGNTKYAAIFGTKALYGVELKTGKKVWEYPWITANDVNAPDPVIAGNKIFISTGYKKGCALLDISGNKSKLVWQNKNIASHFSSFLLIDGYIYGSHGNTGVRDAGLRCLEWSSGELKWENRIKLGSLLAVNNHIIYLDERGILHIAEINPNSYQEVAQAKVLDGVCWTPPVLWQGRLFLRNDRGKLICLDLSK